MFNGLIRKTLYDKRGFMIGWSLGVVIMAGVTIAFFPTIKDQIGTLFANVPKALESVTGSTEDYKNIVGYVGSGIFDLRIPMLTITMAIILALGLGVGEETSGKLYQLLAQPISRSAIVLKKWIASILVFLAVHVALFIGVLATVALIGESMPLPKLFIGTFMCFLLTVAIGSLTTMCGFATGRKGLTIMVVTSYTFGSYLLTSFAAQVDWLKHIEPASIFHYYKASEAVKYGYSLQHICVLVGISVLAAGVGAILFRRRDVGTHNA